MRFYYLFKNTNFVWYSLRQTFQVAPADLYFELYGYYVILKNTFGYFWGIFGYFIILSKNWYFWVFYLVWLGIFQL